MLFIWNESFVWGLWCELRFFIFPSYRIQYNEHKVFRLNFNVLRAIVKCNIHFGLFAILFGGLQRKWLYKWLSFELCCRVCRCARTNVDCVSLFLFVSVALLVSIFKDMFVRIFTKALTAKGLDVEKPFVVSTCKY